MRSPKKDLILSLAASSSSSSNIEAKPKEAVSPVPTNPAPKPDVRSSAIEVSLVPAKSNLARVRSCSSFLLWIVTGKRLL